MNFKLQLLLFISLLFFLNTSSWALELRGYADVTYSRSSSNADSIEENGALAIGELDLFIAGVIRNRIDVLMEVVIEQNIEGEAFVDVERLQVGYLIGPELKIQAGRFHNPLGYWNPNFNHAKIFHTTISRPMFLDFEHNGGIRFSQDPGSALKAEVQRIDVEKAEDYMRYVIQWAFGF